MASQNQEQSGPKYDFRDPVNLKQDVKGHRTMFADAAVKAWGGQCRAHGFHSDKQLGAAAVCALTAFQNGFYRKPPLSTQWVDGDFITLTDQGVHAGDRKIQTHTRGSRYTPKDDGIVAPDELPENYVTPAEDTFEQAYKDVRDASLVTVQQLAEAEKRDFNAFTEAGEDLRRVHDQNMNNLIRRGNLAAKVTGVTNHPGIRFWSASVDWGTADGEDIWDDWQAAQRVMFNSPTQDGRPSLNVLPVIQYDHINGQQYSIATDTTTREWILKHTEGQTITFDHGMNTVDPNGNPGALMFTPRPDLIRVTMPFWRLMLPPREVDELKIRLMVWSRYAGCQIPDVDKVMLVSGSATNWEATS